MNFKEKQYLNFIRTRKLKKYATKSELCVKTILDNLKIKHIFQKGFIQGKAFVIVDFYIPKKKICLEIDGEYHETLKQKGYDKWKDVYLKSRGFKVIRIKNSDINKITSNYFN